MDRYSRVVTVHRTLPNESHLMIDYDKLQALAEEFAVLVTFGATVAVVRCIQYKTVAA